MLAIFLAAFGIMTEVGANVPVEICAARVFRGSAGIGVALAFRESVDSAHVAVVVGHLMLYDEFVK